MDPKGLLGPLPLKSVKWIFNYYFPIKKWKDLITIGKPFKTDWDNKEK